MKYIGSQQHKADRLYCKKQIAEILKTAARHHLHKPNPKVEQLIREIKKDYDAL